MKVLVISHNAIGPGTNMGKTLQSCFQDFSPGEVAQFYIRREVPRRGTVCQNHYRFTDVDALRSLFSRRPLGKILGDGESLPIGQGSALVEAAYQYGRKRTAGIYLLRCALWRCSRWRTGQLWQWAEAFDPDVLFFASGDYGFLYDIAVQLAEHLRKPLVVSCVDDFYLYDRWEDSLTGRIARRSFLNTVQKTMAKAAGIITICPAMQREYEYLFGKKCHVLYTAAEYGRALETETTGEVVYLGNVSLKRSEQLAAMGRTIQALALPNGPRCIHVYSGEKDPVTLKSLTPENGICFHGPVSPEEAENILHASMAVIHTESFDRALRDRLRFSVSTKIPDILMNGPCLIAYGPADIASMDYLIEAGAAYAITDPKQLESGLREILSDEILRDRIRQRARTLAHRNHRPGSLRQKLVEICGGNNENMPN